MFLTSIIFLEVSSFGYNSFFKRWCFSIDLQSFIFSKSIVHHRRKTYVLAQILNQIIVFKFSSHRAPWTVGKRRFMGETLWVITSLQFSRLPINKMNYRKPRMEWFYRGGGRWLKTSESLIQTLLSGLLEMWILPKARSHCGLLPHILHQQLSLHVFPSQELCFSGW